MSGARHRGTSGRHKVLQAPPGSDVIPQARELSGSQAGWKQDWSQFSIWSPEKKSKLCPLDGTVSTLEDPGIRMRLVISDLTGAPRGPATLDPMLLLVEHIWLSARHTNFLQKSQGSALVLVQMLTPPKFPGPGTEPASRRHSLVGNQMAQPYGK